MDEPVLRIGYARATGGLTILIRVTALRGARDCVV